MNMDILFHESWKTSQRNEYNFWMNKYLFIYQRYKIYS